MKLKRVNPTSPLRTPLEAKEFNIYTSTLNQI